MPKRMCPRCQGSGKIEQIVYEPCPYHPGTCGYHPEKPCSFCNGTGRIIKIKDQRCNLCYGIGTIDF